MRYGLGLEANEREDVKKNREVNGFEVVIRLKKC